ncbi:MAG: hypothetical protein QM770_07705 [Tepidisphaeraceae bacterium]
MVAQSVGRRYMPLLVTAWIVVAGGGLMSFGGLVDIVNGVRPSPASPFGPVASGLSIMVGLMEAVFGALIVLAGFAAMALRDLVMQKSRED